MSIVAYIIYNLSLKTHVDNLITKLQYLIWTFQNLNVKIICAELSENAETEQKLNNDVKKLGELEKSYQKIPKCGEGMKAACNSGCCSCLIPSTEDWEKPHFRQAIFMQTFICFRLNRVWPIPEVLLTTRLGPVKLIFLSISFHERISKTFKFSANCFTSLLAQKFGNYSLIGCF